MHGGAPAGWPTRPAAPQGAAVVQQGQLLYSHLLLLSLGHGLRGQEAALQAQGAAQGLGLYVHLQPARTGIPVLVLRALCNGSCCTLALWG